jgi:hypothetical protein
MQPVWRKRKPRAHDTLPLLDPKGRLSADIRTRETRNMLLWIHVEKLQRKAGYRFFCIIE